MRRSLFYWVVLLVVLAAGLGAEEKPLPAWVPDTALLPKLAVTVNAEGYTLKLPKGYTAQKLPKSEILIANAWAGETRADGSRPFVMLVLITPPAHELDKYTIDDVMQRMLADQERRRNGWKQTPVEKGTIDGRPFQRARWSGTDKTTGKLVTGIIYLSRVQNTFLQLTTQDTEPHAATTLPLHEAAMMTFGKETPPAPTITQTR